MRGKRTQATPKPNKTHQTQHHEDHLLTVLADTVPAREIATNMDPLEAFLQTRPFPGSLPRRVGFWTFTDKQQQQVLRVDPRSMAQAPPQRQVETTLHARVQGLHALVHDIEQTVDDMPHDVQGALLTPLTDLHSQLCGLVCVAWLLSLMHPQADDHES